jgi:hypothetical protein
MRKCLHCVIADSNMSCAVTVGGMKASGHISNWADSVYSDRPVMVAVYGEWPEKCGGLLLLM